MSRRSPRRHPLLPEDLVPELRRLARREGVLAVGVGQRRDADGRWVPDEHAVTVRVAHKHDPRHPRRWLPRRLRDLPVQVDGLGAIVAHLGGGSTVLRPGFGNAEDGGCITAVLPLDLGGGRAAVLLSGHGSLPRVAGRLVRRFATGQQDALTARDPAGPRAGRLVAGALGPWEDWAVGIFPLAALQGAHPVLHVRPPWPVLPEAPVGTPVALWSGVRSRALQGVVRGVHESVRAELPDGSVLEYRGCYEVHVDLDGDDVPDDQFSVPGDSGSLVVATDSGRVVGLLVAGSRERARSYVLPIRSLAAPLPFALAPLDLYASLFTEE